MSQLPDRATRRAATLFGVAYDQVTDNQRQFATSPGAFNFLYGQSAQDFAQRWDKGQEPQAITQDQARAITKGWWEHYKASVKASDTATLRVTNLAEHTPFDMPTTEA